MKRVLGVGVVVVLLATTVIGAPVGAKTKKVSTKRYATSVCRTYARVKAETAAFVDAYNAMSAQDPVAFQGEASAAASTLLDQVSRAETSLKATFPDVVGGKRIAKNFASTIGGLASAIATAIDKFRAADPNSPAFVGDVTQFEVAFNLLDVQLGDPFGTCQAT